MERGEENRGDPVMKGFIPLLQHKNLFRHLVQMVVGALFVLLSACSSSNVEPPTPLTEFRPELAVKTIWSRRIGRGVDEQDLRLRPHLAGEVLYANDYRGIVAALQADTGELLWKVDLDTALTSGPGDGEGMVAIGTADGQVIALAAEDGRELWRAQLSSEILAPPAVGGGMVVAHTVDGKLFALAADDGRQRWIYDRTVPTLTLRGTSSPVILTDIVVDGFASGKVALLALRDGRVLWEKSIAVPRGRSELERMVDIDGSPLIIGSVLYVVSYQGRAAAIDLQTGRVLWSRPMSSATGLVADEKALYLTDDQDRVWSLDRASGAPLWQQDALQHRVLTAPVLLDESVVVADREGFVHWLARNDGHFQVRFKAASGIRIAPVPNDGRLYLYDDKGRLLCLEVVPRH